MGSDPMKHTSLQSFTAIFPGVEAARRTWPSRRPPSFGVRNSGR